MTDDWPNSGLDLHLELDPAGGRRSGLEQALRDSIRSGRLAPEARLPASRKLAAELGLSRGTVRAAYDQLIAEGYLMARQGSGTVVARLPEREAETPGTRRTVPEPLHDLRPGSPDVSAFPTAVWLRATRRALARTPVEAYGYGDPRGRIELRTALAEYLGRTRGVLATPDRIVITSGSVQSLALLVQVLGPEASVAMEDPGLPFHRDVVRRAGGTVLPMAVDGQGAGPELPDVDAVLVTSAHQYPTGVTLSPARRRRLTEWARQRGGLIVEDDYDGEFRYDRQPVGAVQGMAPDQVVYLGSASKTLGPALRLGWMVLPQRLVEPVAEAKLHQDHQGEVIGQLTLAELIGGHAYDRHIRAARLRCQRRRDLLLTALGSVRRPGLAVEGIAAGLHALVRLPVDGPTEREVLQRAAVRRLVVGHLGSHWHQPGDHPQGLVVGYGAPSEGRFPAALAALVDTLR